MKYAFIVNPASGNGKGATRVREELKAYETDNLRIYCTEGEQDATVLADSIAAAAEKEGETVNVFACGGDGTIQEIAKGLLNHPNARLGIVPVGSGNDYVRCFNHPEHFMNMELQLKAGEREECLRKVDVLEYTWREGEQEMKDYAINGINIGFDGNTAILAHDLKELPLVHGTGSYLLAVLVNLVKKKGTDLQVFADGKGNSQRTADAGHCGQRALLRRRCGRVAPSRIAGQRKN